MKLLNGRYKIVEKLLSDRTGELFRCVDLESDRSMQIKIYSSEFSAKVSVENVINGFGDLKTLNHPNLSRIFDFSIIRDVDGKNIVTGRYFYTFEDYDQQNIVDYKALTREEIISTIKQVLKCLRYLHFRGINYRFMNFSNILIINVDGNIQVKFKNLLFMKFFNEYYNYNSLFADAFAAPEVTWENADYPGSDIYSFGAFLYYIYFGYDFNVKPLSSIYSERKSNDLIDSIIKMINIEPQRRFDDIDEVIAVLSKLLRFEIEDDDNEYYEKIHENINLIGRKNELYSIISNIKISLNEEGKSGASFIVGDEGLGKSKLIKELIFNLEASGMKVYRADDTKNSGLEICSKLINEIIETEELPFNLIKKHGQDLSAIAPSIVGKYSVPMDTSLSSGISEVELNRLSHVAFKFLTEFSKTKPIIILISINKEIGSNDLIVFENIIRRSRISSVYILFFVKEEAMENGIFKSWSKEECVKQYVLKAFSEMETETFVNGILGSNNGDKSITNGVYEYSKGNPGLVLSLFKEMMDSGVIRVVDKNHWDLTRVLNYLETSERLQSTLELSSDSHQSQTLHEAMTRDLVSAEDPKISVKAGDLVSDNESRLIRSYIFLGNTILEEDFNKQLGFTHLHQALEESIKAKSVTLEVDSRITLAYSYYNIDEFDNGALHLETALDKVVASNNGEVVFRIYPLLCRCYLHKNEYDKAYGLIKKMELEFVKSGSWGSNTAEYFLACIDYFVGILNYDRAEYFIREIHKNVAKLSDDHRNELAIQTLIIRYHHDNYMTYIKNVDYSEFEATIKSIESFKEASLIRRGILKITYGYIHFKKFMDIQKLIEIDDIARTLFDSDYLRTKRMVIEGILENDRIDYYNKLISTKKRFLAREDYWNIYKLLSEEYLLDDNIYMATNSCFTAFDTIKVLAGKLNYSHRENYILYDQAKVDLKILVCNLVSRINAGYGNLKNEIGALYSTVDEYFDIGLIMDIYKDKKFANSVFENFLSHYKVKFDNTEALINSLGNDYGKNIRTTIIYAMQKLVGDRGYLFVLDYKSQIYDVIKTDPNTDVPDISELIRSIEGRDEYLLINTIFDIGPKNLLNNNQKSLLLVPIRRFGSYEDVNRTSSMLSSENNSVLGYVIIESSMIFNNFTPETVDLLKPAINLIGVLADNYYMKKLSAVDHQTGVYNKNYIEDTLLLQLMQSKFQKEIFSIVLCDVDELKQISGAHNHINFHNSHKIVADAIKSTLKSNCTVGRINQDRFLIILPGIDSQNAVDLCGDIIKNIKKTDVFEGSLDVTISFGIAEYPNDAVGKDEIVDKADKSLQFSKTSGNEIITVWKPELDTMFLTMDDNSGFLTGNMTIDAKFVQAVLDIIKLFKLNISKIDKLGRCMDIIVEITEAQWYELFIFDEKDELSLLSSKMYQSDEFSGEFKVDIEMVTKHARNENGACFVNWNTEGFESEKVKNPFWRSYIIMPLRDSEISKGVLVLSSSVFTKEFDNFNNSFVSSFSGIIATLLD